MKEYKSPVDPLAARAIGMEEMLPLIREQLESGGCAILAVRGVSMLPFLKEGRDSVILSPIARPLKKQDIALYQRADGSCILHRIAAVGETYTCIGDAQFVFEKGVAESQMIALVTAIKRKERLIQIKNPICRFYVTFWSITRPTRYFLRRAMRKLRRLLLRKK